MDTANLRLIFVLTDLIAPLAVGYFHGIDNLRKA